MNTEVEVIEQINDMPQGQSTRWLLDLLAEIDSRDPYLVLCGMWRGGQLEFRDVENALLPQWQVEQLFRDRAFNGSERVLATPSGQRFAFGP